MRDAVGVTDLALQPDPPAQAFNLDARGAVVIGAMEQLAQEDHDALVLRFFEGKNFNEVGAALGASEDAAKMRVNRALDKLRMFFKKQGAVVPAAGLTAAISTHAVQAAPAGLAATISTAAAALAGTTIAATTAVTATKAIAMTTLQKAIIGTTLAAAVGAGIYEARQNSQLRDANELLQQQTAHLKSDNDNLSNRLAAIARATSPAVPKEQFSELLRLRGEVARLRQQTSELDALRKDNARLRMGLTASQNPPADGALQSLWQAESNRVSAAEAVIFNAAAGVADKLQALGILRAVNARSDDVVRQMVQAYYSTNDAKLRADIFRQLSGVLTPELKPALLEAVRDTKQDSEIRQEAAETLAHYLPDPDAKAWLEHCCCERCR